MKRDHKANRVQRDLMAQMVLMAYRDRQDRRVHRETPGQLDHKDRRDHKETLDHKDRRDCREYKDRLDQVRL